MKPYNASPVNTVKKKPIKKKTTKKSQIRQGAYGTNPRSNQQTKTRMGQGNRASRNPTNNGLVQGVANAAYPMWSSLMNTPRRKTKGAFPFTGSSGASY